MVIVENERELADWFIDNYSSIGYDEILRKDIGICPDYVTNKNGRDIRVELEVREANFLKHEHDIKDVDEIVCIYPSSRKVPIKTIYLYPRVKLKLGKSERRKSKKKISRLKSKKDIEVNLQINEAMKAIKNPRNYPFNPLGNIGERYSQNGEKIE